MDDPFRIPTILYFIVTGIDLLAWLALLCFSRRHWANFWFAGLGVPLLFSVLAIYLLVVFWFQQPAGQLSDYLSLAGVYRMFGNSGLLLAAWVNLSAADLVVGAWMARKAAQTRMPAAYLAPCLIVTYVFAGFGFPMFLILMAFGERWGAIAKLEKVPPIRKAGFPGFPVNEGVAV